MQLQPVRAASRPLLGSLDWTRVGVIGVAGVLPAALTASNGGYFPVSWGWSAIAAGWVVAVALPGSLRLERLEVVAVGGFAAFAGWAWLSTSWSPIATQSVLEGLRDLVVPRALAAVLLVARVGRLWELAGALVGAVAVISTYALATRLLPDRLGRFDPVAGYRLSVPVGYWNALGLFTALGIVVGVVLVARGGHAVRAIPAAALPILALTLYFTFSRGAALALGIGLLAAVALDRGRLQLLAGIIVLAVPPAAVVWVASRSTALTHLRTDLPAAAADGHRVAALTAAAVIAEALIALGFGIVSRRTSLRAPVARTLNRALALVVVALVVAGVGAGGGPLRLAQRADRAFSAPAPQINGNLNQRLFSFSGTGRADLWRAAWNDYRAHPVLGSGAGSYEQYWLLRRPIPGKVRDAHNLYLETLAELGPIGLVLLLAALAAPLAAIRRARSHPLGAGFAGAYLAFLVHAGVDWDWEVLGVTLAALFCGAGILIAGRVGEGVPLSRRSRIAAIAAVLAAVAVAFVGLVGNIELSRAGTYAARAEWAKAVSAARHAAQWAPWSSEPWQGRGEAQLGLGELELAQASFRKAIATSPKDWSIWFDLARASSGRAQVRALAQAHRLNPLSPEIAEFEKELAAQGQITVEK